MNVQTCCFTGHRNLPVKERADIEAHLEAEVCALIERGFVTFCAGGALGFDTLAAQVVLRLRETHPQIKLVLVLPCKDQARRWRGEDKAVYDEILSQADRVCYVSEHYFSGCMQLRNRRLVEASSVCLCYLTKETGGTAYTVKYAQKMGLEIIHVKG